MPLTLVRLEERIVLDAASGDPSQDGADSSVGSAVLDRAADGGDPAVDADSSAQLDARVGAAPAVGARILVVSTSADRDGTLADAAADDVRTVVFDPATTSLDALLGKIRDAVGLEPAASIALAVHDAGPGAFSLLRDQPVTLTSLLYSEAQRSFWQSLGSLVDPEGRIDILACDLVGSEQGVLVVEEIESLARVQVAASDDLTGNAEQGGDWLLEDGGVDAARTYFDSNRLSLFDSTLAPPTVTSIIRADTDPTNASSVVFNVNFSELVTGVDNTDFTLIKTGTPGGAITGIGGSGSAWTVTVTGITSNGTIQLKLADDDSILNGTSEKLGGPGNGNGDFTGQTYTIDKSAPNQPAITLVTDDISPVTGSVVNGGRTNDTVLVLEGTAENSSSVTIYDGVSSIGTVSADGSGNWTYTTGTLVDGTTYQFNAKAMDAAGNVSVASANHTVTVDTTAPVAPAISSVTDDFAPVTGTVASGGKTNDTVLVLAGTAENNSSVTVYDNATLLGTVSANGFGNWTYTTGTLVNGNTYQFNATATDTAGNVSVASANHTITVDTAAPAAPAISSVTDDIAPVTGTIASGGRTNDTVLVLAGTAENNSSVTVYDNATLLGTVSADGSGNWTYTTGALVHGTTYQFNAKSTDDAGNVSVASANHTVTVDTIATAPTISSVTDDIAPVTGTVASGGRTNDTVLVLAGTAENNSSVAVYDSATLLGTVSADGSGNWTYTTGTLVDGTTYQFNAKATDGAGNVSVASANHTVTIDTTAPLAPAIISVTDDAVPVTGTVTSGGSTNDTNLTVRVSLSGTNAVTGDTVQLYNGGSALGSATLTGTDITNTWADVATGALTNGTTYTINAKVIDGAGNASLASANHTVTVDAVAPVAPAISSVTDDIAPVTGAIASGGRTNDTVLVLAGTAENNSSVTVYDNATLLGTVSADGSGNWTYTTGTLANGTTYQFNAKATDGVGNVSVASANHTVTIDTTAPLAPAITSVADDAAPVTGTVASGGSTNDTNLTVRVSLSGTNAVAGDTVQLYNGGSALGSAATLTGTDITNTWVDVATGALTNGTTYTINAKVIDGAGNVGAASANHTVTVDTTAPLAPAITSVTDDAAPVTGTIASGGSTNDTNLVVRVSLSGTNAVTGDTVQLYNGGSALGSAAMLTGTDITNTWVDVATGALTNGTTYTINAKVIDGVGNASLSSANHTVMVDTAAPAAPAISSVTDDAVPVTGTVASGGRTNDTVLVLAGTAENNSSVTVYDNATLLGTVSADGSGNWTYTTGTLVDGATYQFNAKATDGAGNVSVASANHTVTIDTAAPLAPAITSVTDDAAPVTGAIASGGSTNDTNLTVRVSLSGTNAVAGDTVQLYNGGSALGSAATLTGTDITNTWVDVATGALTNGTTYTINAKVIDGAGNAGAASTNHAVTVDTTAPLAPAITSVTDDAAPVTGTVASGGSTNDTNLMVRVSLSGTNAVTGNTVQLYDGGSALGSAATLTGTDITNAWVDVATGALTNGTTYTISAKVIDGAGNASVASANHTVKVDTVQPSAISDNNAAANTVAEGASNGSATGLTALSTDAPPSTITYSLTDNAGGRFQINSTSGVVTVADATLLDYESNTSHAITIQASDPAGNSVTQSFTIAVTNVNPTANNDTLSVGEDAGSTAGTDLRTNDSDPNTASTALTISAVNGLAGNVGATVAGSSGGAFTINANGSWTFAPGASFQDLAASATRTTTVTVTVSDGMGTSTSTITVTVNGVNDAPTLTASAPVLATFSEDAAAGAGTLVSDLLGGGSVNLADVDTGASKGIAVYAASTASGHWEYSLSGGAWTDLSAASMGEARLLNGTTDKVRFVSDGKNGTVGTLSYYGWDQSTGSVGGTADVNTRGTSTAFSLIGDGASVTVTAVNDAPTLDSAGNLKLTDVAEDDIVNSGSTVAAILSSNSPPVRAADVDTGAQLGIAVTGVTNTNGFYKYSLDGVTWQSFAGASDTTALLLRGTDRIRFEPATEYSGTATGNITFRAWDQSTGFAGGTADTSGALSGGTTAFSSATETATVTVTVVNDAPVIDPGPPLTYPKGSPSLPLAPAAILTDVDDPNLTSVKLEIVGYVAGQDVLVFTDTAQIKATFNAGSGELELTRNGGGNAPIAHFQTALQQVRFQNATDVPDGTTITRSIRYTVADLASTTGPIQTTTVLQTVQIQGNALAVAHLEAPPPPPSSQVAGTITAGAAAPAAASAPVAGSVSASAPTQTSAPAGEGASFDFSSSSSSGGDQAQTEGQRDADVSQAAGQNLEAATLIETALRIEGEVASNFTLLQSGLQALGGLEALPTLQRTVAGLDALRETARFEAEGLSNLLRQQEAFGERPADAELLAAIETRREALQQATTQLFLANELFRYAAVLMEKGLTPAQFEAELASFRQNLERSLGLGGADGVLRQQRETQAAKERTAKGAKRTR